MDLGQSSRAENILSTIHTATGAASSPSYIPELHHPYSESHDARNTVLPQLKDILSTTSLLSIALSSHSQHAAITQELDTVS